LHEHTVTNNQNMAQQAGAPRPTTTTTATIGNGHLKPTRPKRPQKIFGVMTKRRWFGVIVFLCAMLWSYTAGPPLHDTVICNRYFVDGITYDYQTVSFEGNLSLIDKIFKRGFWSDTFTWQIGSYFDFTEGPMWYERDQKLLFSDVIQNKVFSWSRINGVQIEVDNGGHATAEQSDTLRLPGPNGLLQHSDANKIFIAQHAARRIVLYNLDTKKVERVIADSFEGKPFNSPNDLTLGPNGKYLYFTDPPYGLLQKAKAVDMDDASTIGFNGVYRVNIDGATPPRVELLDKFERPNGIAFSSDYSKLFVSNCVEGEFRLKVFSFDARAKNGGSVKGAKTELWDEKRILRNSGRLERKIQPLNGGVGCVDGLAALDDTYLVTTCPGGKICIVNQKSGDLEALIKLPDKTHLSNVAVGGDRNLYVTGNHTVWQIKLQP